MAIDNLAPAHGDTQYNLLWKLLSGFYSGIFRSSPTPPAANSSSVSVNNFPPVQQVSSNDGGLFTVGSAGDAVATTASGGWTVVSLLKGILVKLLGTLAVSVNNFPASQPVSGSVAVTNLPATQPVSGTVNVGNFPTPPSDQLVHGTVNVGNLPAVQPVNGTVAVNNFPATQPVSGSVAVTNLPATQPVSGTVAVSNLPATQPVSGAVAVNNFPAVQPVSNTNLDVPLSTRLKPSDTLAAVTSITNPITEKKDTGRQQLFLSWENVAGVTAESAPVVFTSGSRGAVALPAATSYTVSAGKTLRIQAVTLMLGQNGSTACNYRVRLRQAAAVTNTSPVIFFAAAGGPSNTCSAFAVPIPDGLDIPSGQQIALTHIDTATGGVFSVSLVGFEY